MSLAARQALGLRVDPWRGVHVDTADGRRVAQAVDAALAGALVSVSGPRGAGKTHAVRAALAAREATSVEPLRLDRDRLRLPDVLTAIVAQLSDETPRHSGEARAAQARRLLAGRRAVVVVDDAHLLHGATVRGLRRLREMPWRGAGPLCGVLLLGQRDRTAAIEEVGLRAERVGLQGIASSEATEALIAAYGGALRRSAAEMLAARHANWLDLRAAAEIAVEAAAAVGAQRVAPEHLEAPRIDGPPAPSDEDVQAALAARRAA